MKFGIYTLVVENHMKSNVIPGYHMDFGWGMGYVLIPHNHPFYGKHYDSVPIRVHGGLTFGDTFNSEYFIKWIKNRDFYGDVNISNFEKFNNYWMIGFDTNHYDDNSHNCSFDYVMNETESMLEQCLSDDIEGINNYLKYYLRKDKLKKINDLI